ncbi:hypothetical protein ACEZKA_001442 [Acinetobacter baumannii]|nr:hypothetical protein [Acinetobacter baumannii]EKU0757538.1 hypothetical protein [Acinetobacter baumannii]EKV8391625.1 hypothetical protein [Acinetobacter baumannii]EKW0728130.1 hypothetical protein [Acinetobacter baumannii]EKW0736994.1 hypothetical protein [Acinetobacter baumannii]
MSINGHEYCVQNGINRSNIGKTIYSIASILSSFLIIHVLKKYNIINNISEAIISSILTAILFLLIYKIFNKWIWKLKYLINFLNFPDISGKWKCEAISSYNGGHLWHGLVTIEQSWDKLRIVLNTELSSSESVAAAIIYDPIKGYRILYNYKNEPKNLNGDLSFHVGFVELVLSEDNKSAQGTYYNVAGRTSTGTMTWTKQF